MTDSVRKEAAVAMAKGLAVFLNRNKIGVDDVPEEIAGIRCGDEGFEFPRPDRAADYYAVVSWEVDHWDVWSHAQRDEPTN